MCMVSSGGDGPTVPIPVPASPKFMGSSSFLDLRIQINHHNAAPLFYVSWLCISVLLCSPSVLLISVNYPQLVL
ncbi:unnamed protein product [Prunus brigantina]